MKFYRATSQTLRELQRDGFKPWCPLTQAQAKDLIEYLAGSTTEAPTIDQEDWKTSSKARTLMETVPDKLTKTVMRKNLRDCSSLIINTGHGDKSACWFSACLDPECKGQTKGNPVYTFSLVLKVYEWKQSAHRLVLSDMSHARKAITPYVLCDGLGDQGMKHIALLHGQSGGECEVSFLTKVPGNLISLYGQGPMRPPGIPSRVGRPPRPRARR